MAIRASMAGGTGGPAKATLMIRRTASWLAGANSKAGSPPGPGADPVAQSRSSTALAARMRPATLDEVVGQEALVGSGAPLRRLLERGETPSLLLWGPPGSGKSTLAAVIAAAVRAVPTSLSATSDGVAEVRKAVAAAAERRAHGEQTLLFIDELHRFSRTQQDALLPHVEAGTIILVGATTEPPPRAISPALLSRMRTFRLTALSPDDLATLLQRALDDARGFCGKIAVDDDARRQLIGYAGGDARRMLTLLELAVLMTPAGKPVTPNEVLLAAQEEHSRQRSGCGDLVARHSTRRRRRSAHHRAAAARLCL